MITAARAAVLLLAVPLAARSKWEAVYAAR